VTLQLDGQSELYLPTEVIRLCYYHLQINHYEEKAKEAVRARNASQVKAAREELKALKTRYAEATDASSFRYADYRSMPPGNLLQTLLNETDSELGRKLEAMLVDESEDLEQEISRLEATKCHLWESFHSLLPVSSASAAAPALPSIISDTSLIAVSNLP
jgi:hypothetical protein